MTRREVAFGIAAIVAAALTGAGAPPLPGQDAKFPLQRDARYVAACEQWSQGAPAAALEQFEQLCTEAPEDGMRPALIADFLVKQGAFEAALPFARSARERVPEFPRSFGLLGMCLVQTGQTAPAEAVFRDAVQRHPGEAGMWFNLAIVLGLRRQMLESMDCLDRALALDPGNPQYHYNRGENWLARARYAEAEREFRAAATAPIAHPDSFWRLGQVLAFLGQDEEAEQWFQRSVRLPDRPDLQGATLRAAFQFGVYLFERGRAEPAARLLEQFVAGVPDDRMGWMYLARCQKALGHGDLAAEAMQRYRTLQSQEDATDTERRLREFQRQFEADAAATESGKGSGAGSSDERQETSGGGAG